MYDKLKKLKSILKEKDKTIIAFSGGVDSSLLCKAAYDALGKVNTLAVTVASQLIPKHILPEAESIAKHICIRHRTIRMDIFDVEGFKHNPSNRCYICKRAIFEELIAIADKGDFDAVVEGSNVDDGGDYRPGMKALSEMGVSSPLIEAGLGKSEIRELSKRLGIPGCDRFPDACLASRIPYGSEINKEKLRRIDDAEAFLRGLGFEHVRVRHHKNMARIEINPDQFDKIIDVHNEVSQRLKEIGFIHISLDLAGYRTGSLNEALELNGNGA